MMPWIKQHHPKKLSAIDLIETYEKGLITVKTILKNGKKTVKQLVKWHPDFIPEAVKKEELTIPNLLSINSGMTLHLMAKHCPEKITNILEHKENKRFYPKVLNHQNPSFVFKYESCKKLVYTIIKQSKDEPIKWLKNERFHLERFEICTENEATLSKQEYFNILHGAK